MTPRVTAALATALLVAPFAAADRVTAVRVPDFTVAGVLATTGTPLRGYDYRSFRWMLLEADQLHALEATDLIHEVVEHAGTIQVTSFRFDPLADGEPELPARMRADRSGPGLRLVQLWAPLRDEWRATLAGLGIELLQYYPHNTYLVWASRDTAERATALGFVRWQGAVHPAYKVNTDLEGRSGVVRNVDVMLYNDGDVPSTLADIARLGGMVLQHYPSQPDRRFHDAIVELDAGSIPAVARLQTVLWLGYESPQPTFDDEMSDQIIAGNHPGGIPVPGYSAHLASLGFDGSGVIWAPIDSGVDYDHPDLGPKIVGGHDFPGACSIPGQPGSDCSTGGHGTHVAGIIGGTGIGDTGGPYTDGDGFLYGLGVAPGYSIFAMNSLSAPASYWPPGGGWQEHSKRAVLGSAIGGNNSWTTGEGTQHGYQASERTHDLMVRDGNFDSPVVAEPFIEVFSAGNSGTSGLTAPKEAKNVIVTAASLNYRSGDIEAMALFSSWGPAVDGRWVPTITAPGDEIASTRNDLGGNCAIPIPDTNDLYSYCSGTSMAAPHASGAIVLATEWWRGISGGDDPSPAMAKALLVNSAVDMAAPNIPNAREGWGRISITDMLAPSAPRTHTDQEHLFTATGQEWLLTLGVADPAQPLKISLAWSDAPGAVGANPALVNDLDLEVSTGGDTYLGNVFEAGWSTTGGSADRLNNLENVYVQAPGGTAEILVRATAIVGDGVPLNGVDLDQDFALVCSNCLEEPMFTLDVSPPSLWVCAPADGFYTVDVDSVLGFADPVDLDVTGVPAGATATFDTDPVTPPASTTLTIGSTASAAAGAYVLEVSGTAGVAVRSTAVDLHLFDAAPSRVTLLSPADGATNVDTRPTLEWAPAIQGGNYDLQVDDSPDFSQPIIDVSGQRETSFTPASDLPNNTVLLWRVRSVNGCDTGPWSATFQLTTVALPGDCSVGTIPILHVEEDFESGDPGWMHGGVGDTWTMASVRSHSGDWSYHCTDVPEVSDQYLELPEVELPREGPLTLQFWGWQEIEAEPEAGCLDGGIAEISTDGGSTWTQLTEGLLTDPYDGPISACCSNPLAELDAWCGDPQEWFESVIELDDWAGQTVRLRLRLGTDSSTSREGWYVDDVVVQSCAEEGPKPIFADGFESGNTSAWSETVP